MSKKKSKIVVQQKQFPEIIKEISEQILAENKSLASLAFIGIVSRGYPLAKRIQAYIAEKTGQQLPVGKLDVGPYRDDLEEPGKYVLLKETDITIDLKDKHIILVDDVLFNGRTIRAALNGLCDFGRPECIELAVLVDRGYRQLPIYAKYVGVTLTTKKSDDVQVSLKEVDAKDSVEIY